MQFFFSDLVAPAHPDEFLRPTGVREPRVIQGDAQKFDALFSWSDLNLALEQHRLEAPRVRIEKQGATQAELAILDQQLSARGTPVSRVSSELVYRRLSEGGTLVFDAINEVAATLGELALEMAALFASRPQVNLYASFGSTPGFNVHWDSRDVYVVQVDGRKSWKVFRPHREAPLYRDYHDRDADPGELWWDGIVEKGDLLYVPRGWWHEVVSLDEPSLHLTVGVDPVTGIDWLTWVADSLHDDATFRTDLPLHSEQSHAHFQALLEALGKRLETYDLARFASERRSARSRQSRFSLPYGVDGIDMKLGSGAHVFAAAPGFVLESGDDELVAHVNGRTLRLDLGMAAVMEALRQGHGLSLSDLEALLGADREEVHELVLSLVQENVAYVRW